jgi:hypothetical protein
MAGSYNPKKAEALIASAFLNFCRRAFRYEAVPPTAPDTFTQCESE